MRKQMICSEIKNKNIHHKSNYKVRRHLKIHRKLDVIDVMCAYFKIEIRFQMFGLVKKKRVTTISLMFTAVWVSAFICCRVFTSPFSMRYCTVCVCICILLYSLLPFFSSTNGHENNLSPITSAKIEFNGNVLKNTTTTTIVKERVVFDNTTTTKNRLQYLSELWRADSTLLFGIPRNNLHYWMFSLFHVVAFYSLGFFFFCSLSHCKLCVNI